MAFLYPKIEESLNQKSDIFGQGQSSAGTSESQAPQVQQGGALNRSTEGEVVSGGAGAATAPTQAQATPAQKTAAIFGRNQMNANQGFLQNIGKQVSGAEQGLQQEANQYLSAAPQAVQAPSAQDYDAALKGGDPAAFSRIQNLLSGAAPQAAAWQPKTSTTTDAGLLGSNTGIQEALRRQGGAQYSAGEAALDSALLRRNTEFNRQAEQMADQAKALRAREDEYAANLQKQAQEQINKAYSGAQEGARGKLQSMASQIQAANQAEANAYNAPNQLPGMENPYIAQQIQQGWKAAGVDPGVVKSLGRLGIKPPDARKFYTAPQTANASMMYSPEEAAQFNQIQTLLGQGGAVTQPGAGPVGQQFNQRAYQDALKNWLKERGIKSKPVAEVAKAEDDDSSGSLAESVHKKTKEAGRRAKKAGGDATRDVKKAAKDAWEDTLASVSPDTGGIL